jgi:anti-anti-sigma factor
VSDSQPTLDVEHVRDGPELRIVVTGDLDLATANELVARARPGVGQPDVAEVVLDLSGVAFCDSAGISALIQIRKLADESGQRLRVSGAQAPVVRVLEYSGLRDYLNLE